MRKTITLIFALTWAIVSSCAGCGDNFCAGATCSDYGLCQPDGDRCIAAKDEDCKRSSGCRKTGNCHLKGDDCKPRDDQDCTHSDLCRDLGNCRVSGDFCVRD